MDRRSDTDLLLVWFGSGNSGCTGKLQQVYQQRLQGRPDSVLGELFYLDVRRIRDILGRRLHGARATKTRGRGRGIWSGSGLPCLSIGGTSATWGTAMVLPIFLHATANWTRFTVLHHGGLHYGYGNYMSNFS